MRGTALLLVTALCIGYCLGRSCSNDPGHSDMKKSSDYSKYATDDYRANYEEYDAVYEDKNLDQDGYRMKYANEDYRNKNKTKYSDDYNMKYNPTNMEEYEKYGTEDYKSMNQGKDKASVGYKAKHNDGKKDSKAYKEMGGNGDYEGGNAVANGEYKEAKKAKAAEYTSKDCDASVSTAECEKILKKYKFFKQLYEDDGMRSMLKPDAYSDLEREMEAAGIPVNKEKNTNQKEELMEMLLRMMMSTLG